MSKHQNSSDPSSYSFWTWLLAICLAIYLFWAWQHGSGPNEASACCAGNVATTPYSFSASNLEGYSATGDATAISWSGKTQALLDWLKGGDDWKVTGDANNVTLTGTVDSEAIKATRGEEAQAYFGSDVTINNLLIVNAADPVVAEPVAVQPPPAAKIYFNTGKSGLPADVSETIAPILEWIKNNPNAKVVISGFHDPRGNLEFNQELAKKRAVSVSEILIKSGVLAENIELRKPQNTEGDGDLKEARRTEVSVE